MWTLRWLGCGMLFDAAQSKNLIGKLSVPSKEAAWHLMSKGFQNVISQFEKKIRLSSPISFHSFCNLMKVCKKFFFHVDAIALAAYAEQLLPRSKAAVCCILSHDIVWMHLKKTIVRLFFSFKKNDSLTYSSLPHLLTLIRSVRVTNNCDRAGCYRLAMVPFLAVVA